MFVSSIFSRQFAMLEEKAFKKPSYFFEASQSDVKYFHDRRVNFEINGQIGTNVESHSKMRIYTKSSYLFPHIINNPIYRERRYICMYI